jgi:hypothetical protein
MDAVIGMNSRSKWLSRINPLLRCWLVGGDGGVTGCV